MTKEERLEKRRLACREWYSKNKDSALARNKNWRATHPDSVLGYSRKKNLKKFGITESEYQKLLSGQNGVCAICGGGPNGNGRLHVDHNHESGAVRALLCSNCNPGLGYFRDSIEVLRRAIEYLEKHA